MPGYYFVLTLYVKGICLSHVRGYDNERGTTMNDPQITQWAAEYDAQFAIKDDEGCCDVCQGVFKQETMVWNEHDTVFCQQCQEKLEAACDNAQDCEMEEEND